MPGLSLPAAIQTLNRANKVLRDKHGLPSSHEAPGERPEGTRNGVTLRVKPPRTSKLDQRSQRAQQHEVAGQQLALSERRASTDALDNILSPDEIHQLAATVPNFRSQLSRAAQRILRGESFREDLPAGADGATLEMAAYHLALQCLQPDGDAKSQRDRMTALLTPSRLVTHDPRALAKLFQDAVNPDAEEQEDLINLLIELKGGGADIGDPRETARKLCTPSRDQAEATIDDSDALMAWLRAVLNLPTIQDRQGRHEAVRNELANFRTTPRGSIVAKLLEQARRVGAAVAPGLPAESEAAEDHDPDFLDRLSGLLDKLSFEQLQMGLNENKRRAGEKLPQTLTESEAPAARDAELGATLKELGDLHVASTLVMFVKNTLDFFRRTGRGALDGTRLMRGLMDCLQAQPPEARHYLHLLESVGVKDLESRIVLLTNLKNVVQNLPSKCFASNEARVKALGAIQAALDPFVNAEEDPAAPAPTVPASRPMAQAR